MLEMDRLERQLVNLPLLQDPSSYIPDTVDLTEDALAREYWLYCFEEALDGVRPLSDRRTAVQLLFGCWIILSTSVILTVSKTCISHCSVSGIFTHSSVTARLRSAQWRASVYSSMCIINLAFSLVSPLMFDQVVKRAVASQKDQPKAAERAEKFRQKYRHKLQTLRHQPL